MLKLIENPAGAERSSRAPVAAAPIEVDPSRLTGDPELAEMLNSVRSLLSIAAIEARLIAASGEIGELLAGAGSDLALEGWRPCLAARLARDAPGFWLPRPAGETDTHVALIEPRARDRILILCRLGRSDPGARRHLERQIASFLPLIEQTIGQWTRAHVRDLRLREQSAVFDTLGSGLLVVDADCRIHLINAAARAKVAGSDVLSTTNDRLVVRHLEDAMRFQVTLQHALGSAEVRRDTIIAALRRDGASPILLAISAMPSRGAGVRLAAVQIIDPEAELSLPLETLSRHYDLTQAESRLIEQLVRGKTLAEAAATLRLKEQTARTYLKHIFQKMGLRRQVQLIRIVLAGAVPSLCAA